MGTTAIVIPIILSDLAIPITPTLSTIPPLLPTRKTRLIIVIFDCAAAVIVTSVTTGVAVRRAVETEREMGGTATNIII